MDTAKVVTDFKTRLEPWVGEEVSVWRSTIFKPYVRGQLLRISDDGLVIAGFGVQPYFEIDKVTRAGEVISFV